MAAEIGVIGNPNCGKTTLFNSLTGSNQYVGNWSGVTVEKKTARLRLYGKEMEMIDLPGVYSLSPYSLEEKITKDYLENQPPDMVLNVVDATNLGRNLYLTLQLMETGIPMVIAVNMTDELKKRGERLDYHLLQQELGCPIFPLCARTGEGVGQLVAYLGRGTGEKPRKISYDQRGKEGDLVEQVTARYRVIDRLTQKVLHGPQKKSTPFSDRLDNFILSRMAALPIFFVVLFCMFALTFGTLGETMKNALHHFITVTVGGMAQTVLTAAQAPFWCHSLLIDAVLGGVGSILSFFPQIMLLFFFLSFLEDSGYMARAAFMMDGIFSRIGLTGKSFIPMLMGFGCTTSAVMSARVTNSQSEKRMTVMLIPFMSCSAKLPIYILFAGVFFPTHQTIVLFSIYLLGIAVAVVYGFFLKGTVFSHADSLFMMELPPYRVPTVSAALKHMWEKSSSFVKKAATIILAMSVVVWVLQHIGVNGQMVSHSEESLFAFVGKMLAPVFIPLGFGFWQAAVALLAGLVAKEGVISTMTILYTVPLQMGLLGDFTPLSAVSFMVFCLLYMPCVAAFAAIRREMGSTLLAVGTVVLQTGVAYLVSLCIYQFGTLFCNLMGG